MIKSFTQINKIDIHRYNGMCMNHHMSSHRSHEVSYCLYGVYKASFVHESPSAVAGHMASSMIVHPKSIQVCMHYMHLYESSYAVAPVT